MKESKTYEVRWVEELIDKPTGEKVGGDDHYVYETENKDVAFRKAKMWSKKKAVEGKPLHETHVRELTDGDTTNHWFFKNGEQQISMFS